MKRLILPILTILLLLGAACCGCRLYQIYEAASIRNETMEWELEKNSTVNLDALSASDSEEESTLQSLFYRQEERELLTNTDLNRTAQTTAVCLYGNSALLFNDCYPLTPTDPTECLISSQTALELFGDTGVYDAVISYQDKDYTVKGIITESRPLFIYESAKASDAFDYVYCKQFDKTLGEETMNAYFLANNLNCTRVIMNLNRQNVKSLITKENTYYEIQFLRDLQDFVTVGHVLIFILLLLGLLGFSFWRQYHINKKSPLL